MQLRSSLIGVTAFAAASLLAVPSGPGFASPPPTAEPAPPPASVDDVSERSERETVLAIYDALAERLVQSGYPVALEVDEIHAIDPRDFDQVRYWGTVVSRETSPILSLTETILRVEGAGRDLVHYQPRWRPFPDPGPEAIRQAQETLTVAQAIGQLAEVGIDPFEVRGLTSFRVHTRYDGVEKFHRAALLWLRGGDGLPTFRIVDVNIDRVDTALETRAPLTPAANFEQLQARSLVVEGAKVQRGLPATKAGGPGTADVCEAKIEFAKLEEQVEVGREEHVDGRHRVGLQSRRVCECDTACRSRCRISYRTDFCDDWGLVLGRTHRTHKAVNARTAESFSGDTECSVQVTCAVESCPLGVCGSVSVAPEGVGFVLEGEPIWQETLQEYYACPPCPRIEEPPPGSGGGPGTGPPAPDGPGGGPLPIDDGIDWGDFGDPIDPPPPPPPDSGGGGGVGSPSFDVYCGSEYAGTASSVEEAMALCASNDAGEIAVTPAIVT